MSLKLISTDFGNVSYIKERSITLFWFFYCNKKLQNELKRCINFKTDNCISILYPVITDYHLIYLISYYRHLVVSIGQLWKMFTITILIIKCTFSVPSHAVTKLFIKNIQVNGYSFL